MNAEQESQISEITAEEIADSRGNPTLKVTVTAGSSHGSFSVPSGASIGAHEARALSATDAISKVRETIAPALLGKNVFSQKEIDNLLIKLDGTPDKSNLGANALLAVSIASAVAAAHAAGVEVFGYLQTLSEIKPSRKTPYLFMNLVNGGKHAHSALSFQEYLIVPQTEDVSEAIEMGVGIQNALKEAIIKSEGLEDLRYGDEGGFIVNTTDVRQPLHLLRKAIQQKGLVGRVRLALDVAASSFYQFGKYKIGSRQMEAEELTAVYGDLIKEFDLLSIEDPFAEEDFESFGNLKSAYPKMLVVGDDLTVTNPARLERAVTEGSVSAMIVKPNQIGTLTETLQTMKLARENGVELIVSHRSGETTDDFIADLSYAFGCYGLKAGAPSQTERMAKYKRLAEIADIV